MYRYQNLLELREKIRDLNNNLIILYGALDNAEERIKLNNIERFSKQILRQVSECLNFQDDNLIEIINDDAYTTYIFRLCEIESILKLLSESLEKIPDIIDDDILEGACCILVRLSDECLFAINSSTCKIYPTEHEKNEL